jgi:hypothetical protein
MTLSIVEIDSDILSKIYDCYLNLLDEFSEYYCFENENLIALMSAENVFRFRNKLVSRGISINGYNVKLGEIAKNRILENLSKKRPELYLKYINENFVYFKFYVDKERI